MERARGLSLEGEQLIDSKHYAVDSIRPKCHELQHLCEQFVAEVGRRRELLSKSLELHHLLEAVRPPHHPAWQAPSPPTTVPHRPQTPRGWVLPHGPQFPLTTVPVACSPEFPAPTDGWFFQGPKPACG